MAHPGSPSQPQARTEDSRSAILRAAIKLFAEAGRGGGAHRRHRAGRRGQQGSAALLLRHQGGALRGGAGGGLHRAGGALPPGARRPGQPGGAAAALLPGPLRPPGKFQHLRPASGARADAGPGRAVHAHLADRDALLQAAARGPLRRRRGGHGQRRTAPPGARAGGAGPDRRERVLFHLGAVLPGDHRQRSARSGHARPATGRPAGFRRHRPVRRSRAGTVPGPAHPDRNPRGDPP